VVGGNRSVERHIDRELSYPHYTAVINLEGIEFPMRLKDISKFERDVNQYGIEYGQVLPLLTDDKKEEYVNMQDPHIDGVGHFVWIKNLSHLVNWLISGKKNKKYFCDQ